MTGSQLPRTPELIEALSADDASLRMRAALELGTRADPAALGPLVERCAVEPDFYVREMLTWAITRHPRRSTVPLLLGEVDRGGDQARSQALHTLTKVGAPEAWCHVHPHLLTDPHDEVARTAWRLAVEIVPAGAEAELTRVLVSQFGRGDLEVKQSLARALGRLHAVHAPVLDAVETVARGPVGEPATAQARATAVVLRDPGASFAGALVAAERP